MSGPAKRVTRAERSYREEIEAAHQQLDLAEGAGERGVILRARIATLIATSDDLRGARADLIQELRGLQKLADERGAALDAAAASARRATETDAIITALVAMYVVDVEGSNARDVLRIATEAARAAGAAR